MVRALMASSACAVGASAIVGVLLGAYLHELDANAATAPPAVSTVPTTVSTQVSTLVVTVTPTTTATSTSTQAQQVDTHQQNTTTKTVPQTTTRTASPPATTTQPGIPIPTTTGECHWIWC